MDSKIKPRAAPNSKFDQQMQEIESAGASETMDKRLHLYRALRDQMLSGLRVDQELENKARMDELNKKIDGLERSQRQKEAFEQATKD